MSEIALLARHTGMRHPDTCFDRFDSSPTTASVLRPSLVVPVGFLFDVLWSVVAPDLRLDFVAATSLDIECAFDARSAADQKSVRIEIVRTLREASGSALAVHANSLLESPASSVQQIAGRVRQALAASISSNETRTRCRTTGIRRSRRPTSALTLLSSAMIATGHRLVIAPFSPDAEDSPTFDLIAA